MRIKDIAGVVGLVAIMAFAFYFQNVRDRAEKYDDAVIARDAILQQFNDYKTARDRADAERAAASAGYQGELAALRREFGNMPAPAVRVCPPAPSAATRAAEVPAAGSDASAPAGGSVSAGVELPSAQDPDIGPILAGVLGRCDELSAQLRAILAYMGDDNGT